MKISVLFVIFMTVGILSAFLNEIAAVGDCMVTCPIGCQQQKNCNAIMCICTCDCAPPTLPPPTIQSPPSISNPTPPPPSTAQPPPSISNPTLPPPSTYNPIQPGEPYVDCNTQCCVNAGQRAPPCAADYMIALIDSTLQFSNYCCQNLKDLQTYCTNGYLPLGVPPVNIFQYSLHYHCPGF